MTWLLLTGMWVCGGMFVWMLVAGGTRPATFPQYLPEADTWMLAELA